MKKYKQFPFFILAMLLLCIPTESYAQETPEKLIFMHDAYKKPIFVGCENYLDPSVCLIHKLNEYMLQHFKYPKEAKNKKIQGRVFITFIFTKTGKINIQNMAVMPDDEETTTILKKATTEIFKKLPNVTPAEDINGNPIDVLFNYPLVYKLN